MEKQAALEKIAQVRVKMMLKQAYEAGYRDGMEKKAFNLIDLGATSATGAILGGVTGPVLSSVRGRNEKREVPWSETRNSALLGSLIGGLGFPAAGLSAGVLANLLSKLKKVKGVK